MKNFLTIILAMWFFLFCNFAQADPLKLSLTEAILLAVRQNPNVETSQLAYVQQKFNLWVQQWEFYPHYSFQANVGAGQNRAFAKWNSSSNINVQPGVSLLTPYGTKITVNATNTRTTHYNPALSLQIIQPLIRGFGKPIVEYALHNAIDAEVTSRLTMEGTLRNTITSVINAYLDVVNAETNIAINEDAVKRAEKSVVQTKLFIKAGRKAGNELVTVQADVASAKSNLENAKNSLFQARYALLTAIGIDPNADVIFEKLNLERLIAKYHLPSLETTKELVLQNDIQYQIDRITLKGATCRALMIAKDNTRPILNFTVNAITGNGSGGGYNAGFNSLVNGYNQSQTVGLSLQVPIDDQIAKQAVMNAKISLRNAELGLMKEKWERETSAINGFNLVTSKERALTFAADAEQLQTKTYDVSYQKYLHGLIDSLELQSAQLRLTQAKQASLNARIDYLKSLVNFDMLIGHTLKTWKICMRW